MATKRPACTIEARTTSGKPTVFQVFRCGDHFELTTPTGENRVLPDFVRDVLAVRKQLEVEYGLRGARIVPEILKDKDGRA